MSEEIIKREDWHKVDFSDLEIDLEESDVLPVSVGKFLKEELLIPNGISQYQLAHAIQVPETRISEIVKGRRGITADTAVRLEAFFGISAEFWMRMNESYDLRIARQAKKDILVSIPHYLEVAH